LRAVLAVRADASRQQHRPSASPVIRDAFGSDTDVAPSRGDPGAVFSAVHRNRGAADRCWPLKDCHREPFVTDCAGHRHVSNEPAEERGAHEVKKSIVLGAVLALVSIWVVLAAGITAVWLTEELLVLGLVMVPTAVVASLLVLYLDWRARLRHRIVAEGDEGEDLEKAA
jgi:hypothetical protein